ncbi:helicase-related protein [Thioalkalivibrio sp. ALE19]|uniref:helicase-related protein n=1 Tax=Thioalkalivibrio sp. ALE19 TaxID=1266909 RepID=UPI000687887E|nr:helicase-related protein [Thioalkalivibrio sp. ALE19]
MIAKDAQEPASAAKAVVKRSSSSGDRGLGRLKSFGVQELWQVALLLPDAWDDFRQCWDRFEMLAPGEGSRVLVRGRIQNHPSVKFEGGPPRTSVIMEDPAGETVGFTLFGDIREMDIQLDHGAEIRAYGTLGSFKDMRWLQSAEVVGKEWIGHLRPRYPGKTRVIKPETVRERVIRELDHAIPEAARWIHGQALDAARAVGVTVSATEADVTRWLWEAHAPENPEQGYRAQSKLEMLAALATLSRAYDAKSGGAEASGLDLSGWRHRQSGVPFELTAEQRDALEKIEGQMVSSQPQRHLISGDVGTGKTVVFALAAAANHDLGHHTAIMLPNEPLATQVAREMREMWPDLNIFEVSGGLKPGDWRETEGACVFVGTTALLSRIPDRDAGDVSLVIVDEQQKYSVDQREQMARHGAHVIEATATCIPRTMALVRYGAAEVSQLRQCHTPKEIVTEICRHADSERVWRQVAKTVGKGYQALVIYPLKEDDEEGNPQALLNAAAEWKALWGERVSVIHGAMTTEEKSEALRRMRDGEADILLGTTVVEVGVNLPQLRHIVITDASRYGVTQVHQLRGRAARQGGKGLCSLIIPDKAKDRVYERLSILERTQDGFEVAEHDLKLRGFGNLSSDEGANQSGADETFLFGRTIGIDVADRVAGIIQQRLAEQSERN